MKQICITAFIVGVASAISAPAFAADTGLNGWGRAYAEAVARKQAEAQASGSAVANVSTSASAGVAMRADGSANGAGTARPADRPAISLFQKPTALIDRPVVIDRAMLPERPTIIRPERIAAILR